ncbi:hypothetical protein [Slackia piriformis]|uniref:hypothetical protein n=1 Tax=Slackia piriformis TaxID=626934 RepID=UPI0023F3E7D5|nr:hypothetical protein [Slackia piriformis]
MTVERYATARDLFEAARTAAQELERTATQRELLASRRGYRSPSLSGAGGGCSADAGGMRASDALIDYEAMMRGRVADDAELLEYASHVLYGEGGVSSALGGIYADVLCWRYLMACTWSVTAMANHMDERTAKVYADSAIAAVDSCGMLESVYPIAPDRT